MKRIELRAEKLSCSQHFCEVVYSLRTDVRRQQETIYGWECSNCLVKHAEVYQINKVHKLPLTFIVQMLQIKRFDCNGIAYSKNNRPVQFQEETEDFRGQPYPRERIKRGYKYKLIATINHAGNTLESGHYYCHCWENTIKR